MSNIYSRVKAPIVGNKVCMPDAWNVDDILQFCKLFKNFKFIFIVRNPYDVVMSRLVREDYSQAFNALARDKILLDFRSVFLTYTSSWRQSIESYWKLRDGYPDNVQLVYYEDFCQDFEAQIRTIFELIEIDFHDQFLSWQSVPHCDKSGNLKADLKYQDSPVNLRKHAHENSVSLVDKEEITRALATISHHQKLWESREL